MSSDYFREIERRLKSASSSGVSVSRYRITWREYDTMSAGIRDNDLLGVYSPLRTESGCAGSWLLEWSDGLVSTGNLDGASLSNFDELLAASVQSRREDPDAAVFSGPATIESVPVHSDDVDALFRSDPGPVAAIVRDLLDHGNELGARNTSAGAYAGRGLRGVWTSEGLRLEDPYTSFSFYSYLEGEVGEGFGSCKLFSRDEVGEKLRFHDALFRGTREDRAWGSGREALLVLHPDAVESFLDHFLLSNLGGSAIAHGQSRWNVEDFAEGLRAFRHDLTIRVEPGVPYHYAAFNFTGEGVPARPTAYIREGRLEQPVLNLKYAHKLRREPTTPPRGGESLRIELRDTVDWRDLLPATGDGLLVMNVLGMHTQDSVRGDYSLAVPTGALLESGAIVGKCRAVLEGNFFEDLNAESLQAVRFEHHDLPGLAVRTVIAPDKG